MLLENLHNIFYISVQNVFKYKCVSCLTYMSVLVLLKFQVNSQKLGVPVLDSNDPVECRARTLPNISHTLFGLIHAHDKEHTVCPSLLECRSRAREATERQIKTLTRVVLTLVNKHVVQLLATDRNEQ